MFLVLSHSSCGRISLSHCPLEWALGSNRHALISFFVQCVYQCQLHRALHRSPCNHIKWELLFQSIQVSEFKAASFQREPFILASEYLLGVVTVLCVGITETHFILPRIKSSQGHINKWSMYNVLCVWWGWVWDAVGRQTRHITPASEKTFQRKWFLDWVLKMGKQILWTTMQQRKGVNHWDARSSISESPKQYATWKKPDRKA